MTKTVAAPEYDKEVSEAQIAEDRLEPVMLEAGSSKDDPRQTLQPPPLVAAMTPEERDLAEKRLRRKIDTRLMPMAILMYIMSKSS